MKTILCFTIPLLLLPLTVIAEANPNWLRQPAVSPDGKQIAFIYSGQLWRMPAEGGEAVPLTSALFRAGNPVWSPDSRTIAFSADRHGNPDVFTISAAGGEITRLTSHSMLDTPQAFSSDGKSLYFNSMRLGDPKVNFGGVLMGTSLQLYQIPLQGGRERLEIALPALDVSRSPDGRFFLYTNFKSSESEWRKHAVSEATRDIWLYDSKDGTHRQLTDWRGEDRNAVWSADGKSFYWLSERSGSFNVWKQSIDGQAKPAQVTFHEKHPVRFLSVSKENDLVYGFDGEIWRLAHSSKDSAKVNVHISQGSLLDGVTFANISDQVSEVAVSADGTQLGVIARGEVFVIDADRGTTRRVTDTPQHEKNLSFRPDGKAVIYVSERDGTYDIFESTMDVKDAPNLLTPGAFKETRLTTSKSDLTEPAYSPDGNRLAFLENRTQLVVMDVATKTTTIVMPKGLSYSYTDGDLPFIWSPDGRWLAATTGNAASHFNIHLVDSSGKQAPVGITRTGLEAVNPKFSPDGRTLYYMSSRNGLKTLDSKTAEVDVYATFLTQAAYDAVARPDDTPPPEEKDWQPELKNIGYRTLRITPLSGQYATYCATADGKSVVVVSVSPTSGMTGYTIPLGKPGLAPLFNKAPAAVDSFPVDTKGNLYFIGAGVIERVNLATGPAGTIPFKAEIAYDLRGEMRWFFDHVARLTAQKFYRADMGGVDWDFYVREYAKHLPSIHRGEDLAELFSELAGELNASHMGSHYTPLAKSGGDETASLGLYYDHRFEGPGAKIIDYLPIGPAARAGSKLRPGAIILTVNGKAIEPNSDIHTLLNHAAGNPLRLTIQPADGGAIVEEIVTPEPYINSLIHSNDRWVSQNAELVEKLSGGRLGYVHIATMLTPDYQGFYSDLFGKYADREGVVVDVRFNGGGNLSDRLISDLSAKSFGKSVDRDGNPIADVPAIRWTKPSILLANAFSYSDGSIFPHLYKESKLGTFIGEPVPGTGTSVWWVDLLPGKRFTYGIPEIGRKMPDGRFYENTEDSPDIIIRRNPDAIEQGRDEQLEAAVSTLLEQLKKP